MFVLGCKGSDGDDGTANITISGNVDFKSSPFALGCLTVSETDTSCLFYESGTEYTGTASGSTYCNQFPDYVNLVALDTKLENVAIGPHDWCMTYDATVDCTESGMTGTATISAKAGEDGGSEMGVLPKDGDNGAVKNYTLTFVLTTATIIEN